MHDTIVLGLYTDTVITLLIYEEIEINFNFFGLKVSSVV